MSDDTIAETAVWSSATSAADSNLKYHDFACSSQFAFVNPASHN